MHIGRMEVRLWDGSYIIEDLRIDGLTPTIDAVPRRQADHGRRMPGARCSTAVSSSNNIEMTDWRMHVETHADGRHNFPDSRATVRAGRAAGRRRWPTCARIAASSRTRTSARRGASSRATSTSSVEKPTPTPTIAAPRSSPTGSSRIQKYVPFRTDMDSSFKIDGGRVIFDRM